MTVSWCVPGIEPASPTHNALLTQPKDDLQIPSTLRPKLAGMEPTVKAAMLKSSHVLGPAATATAPAPTRGRRRVQSGSSIESPPKGSAAVLDYPANGATTPDARGGPSAVTATTTSGNHHSRGVSIDVPRRPKSRSGFTTPAVDPNGTTVRGKVFSPVQIVSLLTGKSSLELEVDVVKKLRLLLRNESAR